MTITTVVDDKWRQEFARENKELEDCQRERNYNRYFRHYDTRPLMIRAEEALAWGVPDSESIGLSHEEWDKLTRELVQEIKRLKHVR